MDQNLQGEGKTSAIQCIHTEINDRFKNVVEEKKPIIIDFNPWLFTDERQLIRSFFTIIAGALGRKLKNSRDKILEVFSRYAEDIGAIVDFKPRLINVGAIFKGAKKVADDFKRDDSIEAHKKRIEDFIQQADVNLVVFIDDIDRLDIKETQLVFKLVKLLADFPRTAYILAFDDELVAQALSEQYPSEKNKKPGYTFLEKIIQIPLHLPKADTAILRNFVFGLIENVHEKINLQLSPTETAYFETYFDSSFLPVLQSPRAAIRFANSLGFIIPLVGKEVNVLELMMLEAIKAFYPEVYQYIRGNPEYFLLKKEQESLNPLIKEFDQLLGKYPNSRNGLSAILKQLFPLLWTSVGSSFDEDQAYVERRISSPKYFNRYFSYAVQKGEMSDIFFEDTINKLSGMDNQSATNHFQTVITKDEIGTFLYKISLHARNIPDSNLDNVGQVLKNIIHNYTEIDKGKLFKTSDKIVELIASLGKYIPESRRGAYIVNILNDIAPFETACAVARGFIKHYSDINPKNDRDNLLAICNEEILKRFRQFVVTGESLAKLTNDAVWILFNAFYETNRGSEMRNIVLSEIKSDPRFSLRIVQMSGTMTYHPHTPHFYQLKFLNSTKDIIEKLIPVADLFKAIVDFYGEVKDGNNIDPNKGSNQDYLAIAQFQRLYKNGFDLSKAATA